MIISLFTSLKHNFTCQEWQDGWLGKTLFIAPLLVLGQMPFINKHSVSKVNKAWQKNDMKMIDKWAFWTLI